jgi:hypothetical protein
MMDSSVVNIEYEVTIGAGDWFDIASHCVIEKASFDSASNATPGTCEVTLRDPDQDLGPFITGHRFRCRVDGQSLWGGFVLNKGRSSFFPAGDGLAKTKARSWTLRGVDYNKLLDARALRNTGDYLGHFPYITTDRYDGWMLRDILANWTDMPAWLDCISEIDDVAIPASNASGHITAADPYEYVQQGSKLRDACDDLDMYSAAVYYIGPDEKFHYHALQTIECPWGFSDRPNHLPIVSGPAGFQGAYYGFRELMADEIGDSLVTDEMVWGGSAFAGAGGTVFARAVDPTMEGVHGKWQAAETHFDETNFKLQAGVTIRANMVVFGNPEGDSSDPSEPGTVVGEGPRGLRFSQWSYSFSWHTSNVPLLEGVPRHLYPGDIVPIELWAYSEDEGVTPLRKWLPLRTLHITFPTGVKDGTAVCRFDGTFDLRNEDSTFLWAYLRGKESKTGATIVPTASDASDSALPGSEGTFIPTPAPDGETTVFNVKFGYMPTTVRLFYNGLEQRPGVDFTESDPDTGEITLMWAPAGPSGEDPGDTLMVTCKTLAG